MEFKCISSHPEDLEDGRVIGVGEKFDMTREQAESPYNRAKLAAGRFIALTRTGQQIVEDAKKEGEDAISNELHRELMARPNYVPPFEQYSDAPEDEDADQNQEGTG